MEYVEYTWSYYIFFFQFRNLAEFVFSTFDFAVLKFTLNKIGTPLDEVEEALNEMGVRQNEQTLTSAINWYRANMAASLSVEKLWEKPEKIKQNVLILWGEKDPALTTNCITEESNLISGEVSSQKDVGMSDIVSI